LNFKIFRGKEEQSFFFPFFVEELDMNRPEFSNREFGIVFWEKSLLEYKFEPDGVQIALKFV